VAQYIVAAAASACAGAAALACGALGYRGEPRFALGRGGRFILYRDVLHDEVVR